MPRLRFLAVGLLFLLPVGFASAQSPSAPAYPDHSKLLVVRDATGNETPVKNAADWEVRRAVP